MQCCEVKSWERWTVSKLLYQGMCNMYVFMVYVRLILCFIRLYNPHQRKYNQIRMF